MTRLKLHLYDQYVFDSFFYLVYDLIYKLVLNSLLNPSPILQLWESYYQLHINCLKTQILPFTI